MAGNSIMRSIIRKTFPLWQSLGFHITANHFYEPIPDTRELKEELWLRNSKLVGVDINEEKQLGLLSLFSSKFKGEYESFPGGKASKPYEYFVNNGGFESVDGEILYCMIRHFKPRRIIEIGSGISTYLAAQTILRNKEDGENYECELTVIEPYPNDVLKAGFPGLSKLSTKKVQDTPLSEFDKLKESDILFIDSSHVLKIGSDVQCEYLEILPRLNKGVIVHAHDIYLPAEYHKNLIFKNRMFWTEQYMLQAFLTFNDRFEVLWAASYMHMNHPEKLGAAFSSYNSSEMWPASFWIRRVK